jgi:hypothetical protein
MKRASNDPKTVALSAKPDMMFLQGRAEEILANAMEMFPGRKFLIVAVSDDTKLSAAGTNLDPSDALSLIIDMAKAAQKQIPNP